MFTTCDTSGQRKDLLAVNVMPAGAREGDYARGVGRAIEISDQVSAIGACSDPETKSCKLCTQQRGVTVQFCIRNGIFV